MGSHVITHNCKSIYPNLSKAGRVSADDVPPIRVFERDGKLYSLDNRRLYAFQEAGVPIRSVWATADEVTSEAWKFTTRNDGVFVRVR